MGTEHTASRCRPSVGDILWYTGTAFTIAGFAWSIYLIFIATGLDRTLGFSQKIFYYHVPCAWVTYLAFGITGVFSAAYLVKRRAWMDRLAHSSLEVGTVFTTLVLVTGPLWAKPAWGAYWVWDVRLTTTLILWLIEVAYLMLREFVGERHKAAVASAVLALLGLVDIPIIHYSVRLWRGLHPQGVVMAQEGVGGGLPGDFLFALMVSLASFTLLFSLITSARYGIQAAREEAEALRETLDTT